MREAIARADLHKIQQTVKWIVYALLIANFGVYIYEDVDRALHTLTGASSLLDWTGEFATTMDTIEAITWLVIIFAIEIVVRQQGRGVIGGMVMTSAKTLKLLGYGILLVLAGWWAYLGHWVYTWDTFVWIAGFAAIEMNVHEWRDELLDEQGQAV
ncbi:hypothetical protein [Lentisalinibacter salinarum]|uniref:hypothetical protein n=1 Tax=Lentisalinibacter salinarum TaxID=2992239 RepID=UPI00386D9D2E